MNIDGHKQASSTRLSRAFRAIAVLASIQIKWANVRTERFIYPMIPLPAWTRVIEVK